MGVVKDNGDEIGLGAGPPLERSPKANLTGAWLSSVDLNTAMLIGAVANEDTRWPEGFDPVAAGVIFI